MNNLLEQLIGLPVVIGCAVLILGIVVIYERTKKKK